MIHYYSNLLYKNAVLPAKYGVTALAGEYWLQIH